MFQGTRLLISRKFQQLSLDSQSNFLLSDLIQVAWALLGRLPDQLVDIVLLYDNPCLCTDDEFLYADQLGKWIIPFRIWTRKMLQCKVL